MSPVDAFSEQGGNEGVVAPSALYWTYAHPTGFHGSDVDAASAAESSRGSLTLGGGRTTTRGGRVPAKQQQQQQQRGASGAGDNEGVADHAAVSDLQEFVQSSKTFVIPPEVRVLQWQFDRRRAPQGGQFRAFVTFLLDGLPHHCAGSWQNSKAIAKRDTSERVLNLFTKMWRDVASCQKVMEFINTAQDEPEEHKLYEFQVLEEFCHKSLGTVAPSLYHEWKEDGYEATIDLDMSGGPHSFPGLRMPTLDEAILDTTRRVLWYLQVPGFEDIFEMDAQHAQNVCNNIPAPPITSYHPVKEDGGARF